MAVLRIVPYLLFAGVALLAVPLQAQAQLGSASILSANAPASSLLPQPGRSYLGLNVGRSAYRPGCNGIALVCDDADRSVKLYAGTKVGDFWGVELGYLNMGRIARAGGETRAQGVNFSLVGKAPLWQSFGVYGKVGPTWSRTEALLPGGGIAAGAEHGFGLSYSAGVSFDFTPRLSATLEWESNDYRFAGSGRDTIRSTSLGLKYRY